jgi:predicted Zn-dependent protease
VNKRLAFLEQTTRAGTADSFAWYALGLEYRKEQRIDEALATFQALRERDPAYLPLFLMAGQTLVEAGRAPEAKAWLEAGVTLARDKGDGKALGELESLLAEIV